MSAPRIDGLSLNIIRIVLPCILSYMAHIFNHCLLNGAFPSIWKQAIVCSIPKINCLTELKHYRSVSILCTVSKIFERLITNQISNYVESNNYLDKHQDAYRRNFSTQTALLRVIDDIRHATDSREVTVSFSSTSPGLLIASTIDCL